MRPLSTPRHTVGFFSFFVFLVNGVLTSFQLLQSSFHASPDVFEVRKTSYTPTLTPTHPCLYVLIHKGVNVQIAWCDKCILVASHSTAALPQKKQENTLFTRRWPGWHLLFDEQKQESQLATTHTRTTQVNTQVFRTLPLGDVSRQTTWHLSPADSRGFSQLFHAACFDVIWTWLWFSSAWRCNKIPTWNRNKSLSCIPVSCWYFIAGVRLCVWLNLALQWRK